jgi:ACR3 family arsenite transporter
LLLSIGIYVALPLLAGYFSRKWIIQTKGIEWFERKFLHLLTPVTIIALLITLVLLFSFKGEVILSNPLRASNHFEVAIATATMIFGISSGAALATVVGVLIEVPVMLMLVKICLNSPKWFTETSSPEYAPDGE